MSTAPTATTETSAPKRIPVGFALGFAIFGGPAAWSLQLLIDYTLASHACYPNTAPLATPIWGFLWWVLIGVECLAFIAAGLAGFIAVGNWRKRRNGEPNRTLPIGELRNRFLTNWAMLTSTLFFIELIFSIVMLFIVPVCNV
jgi:hypothetical protein